MSKETRALTAVGNVITQVKPVSVSAKSVTYVTEKNKSLGSKIGAGERHAKADVGLTSKKQSSPDVRSGAVAVKNRNFKSIFVAVAVIGIFVAVAISTYQNYLSKTNSTKLTSQRRVTDTFRVASAYTDYELSAIASQENVTLPKMVDKSTRLDSIIGVSDELQYHYTLVDTDSDSVSWASLKDTLERSLVNWVCTTRHIVEVFISQGVTVSFAYFGNDKRLIGVISVEPSQCATKKRSSAK
jgi:Tfp pilus assembly major pilin PilA